MVEAVPTPQPDVQDEDVFVCSCGRTIKSSPVTYPDGSQSCVKCMLDGKFQSLGPNHQQRQEAHIKDRVVIGRFSTR